jgi:hypothetical protein
MTWSPKTLKCQLYEDDCPVDLANVGDPELENIADEIVKIWKLPTGSSIWFDVEIYEKQNWFKDSKTTLEVVCFKQDPNAFYGRTQISISKLYIDKMLGKKFQINPKSTVIRKWNNLEVVFVV